MGHGPSLQDAIAHKSVDETALNAEIDRVRQTLNNTEDAAYAYIDSHTNGIIRGADNSEPEIVLSNKSSYTKYSEEYSLDKLDLIIDQAIDSAKKGMAVYKAEGVDPKAVEDLVGSIGGLVKAGLALASSDSKTTTDLTITFSQFNVGDKNFAVYSAVNSAIVSANNAWGSKEITLVAQTSVLARVKPDPNLTYSDMLAADLNHLENLNNKLNELQDQSLDTGVDNAAALALCKTLIDETNDRIKADRLKISKSSPPGPLRAN